MVRSIKLLIMNFTINSGNFILDLQNIELQLTISFKCISRIKNKVFKVAITFVDG